MDKATALSALEAAAAVHAQAEQARDDAARAAHTAGASWADIAAKLGISKQRAHQRYSGPARDTSRDSQYTPAENAEADRALAALQAVAASKIVDADVAGDSITPSIFLEPKAPATPWKPAKGSPLHSYDNRETSNWYETYGCGECDRKDRPDTCPNCRVRTKEGTK